MSSATEHDFEAHRAAVYGWALRILGQAADAEDVTQDVGLRWLQRDRQEALASPRAWLRRVTVNRALDLVRQRDVRSSADSMQDISVAGSVTGPIEFDELRAAVNRALLELTDAQRQVLCAKVFDGLTFAAIAQQMQLATPTVKTHYLRALTAMSKHLGPRWNPREHDHER